MEIEKLKAESKAGEEDRNGLRVNIGSLQSDIELQKRTSAEEKLALQEQLLGLRESENKLQGKLAEQGIEIDRLHRSESDLQSKLKGRETELSAVSQTSSQQAAALESALAQLAVEKEANADYRRRLSSKHDELGGCLDELQRLRDDNTKLRTDLADERKQRETREAATRSLEARLQTTESMLQSSKQGIGSVQKDLDEQQQRIQTLTIDMETTTQQKMELQSKVSVLEDTVTTRDSELSKLDKLNEELSSERSALTERLGEANSTIRSQQDQLDRATSSLDNTRKSLVEKDVRLKATLQENAALREEETKLVRRIEALEKEADSSRDQEGKQAARLLELDETIDRMAKRSAELQQIFESEKAELLRNHALSDEENDQTLRRLQEELAATTNALTMSKDTVGVIQQEKEELKRSIQSLQAETVSLETARQEAAVAHTKAVETLQGDLENIMSQRDDLVEQIKTLEDSNQELLLDKELLRIDAEQRTTNEASTVDEESTEKGVSVGVQTDSDARLEQANETARVLQRRIAELEDGIKKRSNLLAGAQKALNSFRQSSEKGMNVLKKKFAMASREKEEHKELVASLRRELDNQLTSRYNDHESKILDFEKDLEVMEGDLNNLLHTNGLLEKQLNETKSSLHDAETERDDLLSRVKALSAQVTESDDKLEKMSKENASLKTEVDASKSRLAKQVYESSLTVSEAEGKASMLRDDLMVKLTEAEESLAEIVAARMSDQAEIERLVEESRQHTERLEGLDSELQAAQEAKATAERLVEETTNKLNDALADNKKLVAATTKWEEEKDEYQAAKAMWQVALDAREQMVQDASKNLESVKTALQEAERNGEMKQEELVCKVNSMEDQLTETVARCERLEELSEEQLKTIARLEESVETKESEAELLADKLLDLREKLRLLSSNKESIDLELATVRMSLAEANQHMVDLQSRLTCADETIEELRSSKQSLRQRLLDSEASNEEKEDAIQLLKTQMEDIASTHSRASTIAPTLQPLRPSVSSDEGEEANNNDPNSAEAEEDNDGSTTSRSINEGENGVFVDKEVAQATATRVLESMLTKQDTASKSNAFRRWVGNATAMNAVSHHLEVAEAMSHQLKATRDKLKLLKTHLKKDKTGSTRRASRTASD